METRRRVLNGEIGDIVGANIIRNGGALWSPYQKARMDRHGIYAAKLGKLLLAFGRPHNRTIYPRGGRYELVFG